MTAGDHAVVIGIVGAAGTGKTQLAQALAARLTDAGLRAVRVGAARRAAGGPAALVVALEDAAAEQTRRIAAAATTHEVVVADTTALSSAVDAELDCGDTRLHATAGPAHARCALSLLMALDLPASDRGADRRDAADALLRAALLRSGRPFAVVTGHGEARVGSAWRAVRRALHLPLPPDVDAAGPANWHGYCERCDVAACERHLLPRLPTEPSGG